MAFRSTLRASFVLVLLSAFATATGCGGESDDDEGAGEAGETATGGDAGSSNGGRAGGSAGKAGSGGKGSGGGQSTGGAPSDAGEAGLGGEITGGSAGEGGTPGGGTAGTGEGGEGGEIANIDCDDPCDDENPCTEDSCEPGRGCQFDPVPVSSLEACKGCDGDGGQELLTDDELCGDIDCSGRYSRAGDNSVLGTKECYPHAPLTTGRCTTAGACRADNSAACANTPLAEDPQITCGECKTLVGCDGTTPGSCANVDNNTLTGATCGIGACVRNEVCSGGVKTCVAGTPAAEICDDGIDQDCNGEDLDCLANDVPTGAFDISAGGTFTGDLTNAANHQDDSGAGCGSTGGKDVFFTFTLPAAEVVYLQTYGSSFDSVLRIYAGACTALGAQQVCYDDTCNVQAAGAIQLAAGQYCVVLDQFSSSSSTGAYSLTFVPTRRTGTVITASSGAVSGTTTGATNLGTPSCQSTSSAPDVGYYFLSCPSESFIVGANTCSGTTWDTVLSMYSGATTGTGIACNDDSGGVCTGTYQSNLSNVVVTGPNIHWMVVDGYQAASGAFTLTYTITASGTP